MVNKNWYFDKTALSVSESNRVFWSAIWTILAAVADSIARAQMARARAMVKEQNWAR